MYNGLLPNAQCRKACHASAWEAPQYSFQPATWPSLHVWTTLSLIHSWLDWINDSEISAYTWSIGLSEQDHYHWDDAINIYGKRGKCQNQENDIFSGVVILSKTLSLVVDIYFENFVQGLQVICNIMIMILSTISLPFGLGWAFGLLPEREISYHQQPGPPMIATPQLYTAMVASTIHG